MKGQNRTPTHQHIRGGKSENPRILSNIVQKDETNSKQISSKKKNHGNQTTHYSLHDEWVKDRSQKVPGLNRSYNTIRHTLWDMVGAVLYEGCVASSSCVKKPKRAEIKDLMMQLKKAERHDQAKPQSSRWQEVIKIRAKMNEMEIRNQWVQQSFFERINLYSIKLENLWKMDGFLDSSRLPKLKQDDQ